MFQGLPFRAPLLLARLSEESLLLLTSHMGVRRHPNPLPQSAIC